MVDNIKQVIEIDIESTSFTKQLDSMSKGIHKVVTDLGSLSNMVGNNFKKMNEQLLDSTKNLNLGAVFNSYFSGIRKNAEVSFNAIGKAFDTVTSKSVNIKGLEDVLKSSESKIKALQSKIEQSTKSGINTAAYEKELAPFKALAGKIAKEYQGLYSEVGKASETVANQIVKTHQTAFKLFSDMVQKASVDVAKIQTRKVSGVEDVLSTKQSLTGIKALETDLTNHLKSMSEQRKSIEYAYNMSRFAYEKQTDEQLKALNYQHLKTIESQLVSFNTTYKSIQEQRATLSRQAIEAERLYMNQLKASADITANTFKNRFTAIRADMESMKDKASVQVGMKSTGGLEQAKIIREDYRSKQVELAALNSEIRTTISLLEKATKEGKGDFTPTIKGLQSLQREFVSVQNETRSWANGMDKSIRAVNDNLNKSFGTKLWEDVRNFRWQYAAVAYLVKEIAQGVQHFFTGVIDKVAEYRMQIYGLAASIGMNVIQPMKTVFDNVFSYSEMLLNKLTAASAQSYASLEDLLMLTKTFAQAGIVPKSDSDEDIKNIALIGTAIKLLTEGMSNAGTQMKQELNAFILGRQRATDQLAMMFRLLGVDIKKEMATWEAEGKNVMQGLAGALSQFQPVNERIAQEYTNQVKLLKEMWTYIQRIALSDFIKSLAGDLSKVTAMFGKLGGELTPLGKASVMALKEVFQDVYIIVKDIVQLFAEMMKFLSWMVGSSSDVDEKMKDVSKSFDSTTMGVLKLSQHMLDVTNFVHLILAGIKDTFAPLMGLVEGFKSIASSAAAIAMYFTGNLTGAIQAFSKANQQAGTFITSWGDMLTGNGKYYNEAIEENKKRTEDFITSLKKLNEQGKTTFGDMGFDVLETSKMVMEELTKINKEYTKYHKKSGEKEFQLNLEEFEATEKLDFVYGKITETIGKLRDFIEKNPLDLAGKERAEIQIAGYEKTLEELKVKYKEVYDYFRRELDEYYIELERKDARALIEYNSYFNKLTEAHQTAFDKLALQTDAYYEEVNEKARVNEYYRANLGVLYKTIYENSERAKTQLLIEANDTRLDIQRRAYGKELTEYQKITEDIQNLMRGVDKSDLYNAQQKADMKIDILKGQFAREQELYRKQSKELQSAQIATVNLQAKLLSTTSIRPEDVQKAKIIEIVTAYKQVETQIYDTIKANEKLFGGNEAAFEAYKSQLMQQLDLQKQIAEAQIKDVQEPFWTKMKEMTQEWADQLADALTTLVTDFDNFGKNITSLFKSIMTTVTKTIIKTSITDPIVNMLSGKGGTESAATQGFFGGSFNPLKLLMGGSSKSGTSEVDKYLKQYGLFGTGAISTANPLPVTVTNLGSSGLTGGTGEVSTASIDKAAETVTNGLQKSFTSNLSSTNWFAGTEDKIKYGMEFFTGKGLTTSQASGLMGNLMVESGFNTNAWNATEKAFGTAQWRLNRLSGLESFASSMGTSKSDYGTQLDYVWKELNSTHKNALESLKGTTTSAEAAVSVRKNYEVAAAKSDSSRISASAEIEKNFKDIKGSAESTQDSFKTISGTSEGTLDNFKTIAGDTDKLTSSLESSVTGKTGTSGLSTLGTMTVTATTVYVNGSIAGGAGGLTSGSGGTGYADLSKGISTEKSTVESVKKATEESTNSLTNGITSTLNKLTSSLTSVLGSITSSIGNLLSGLVNSLSSIFSGSSGSSSSGGLLGGLFGGSGGSSGGSGLGGLFSGIMSIFGMAEGGVIEEPIFGVGLKSGSAYSFGEKGNELVVPEGKGFVGTQVDNTPINMVLSINAIDTQSGTEFLLKNSDMLQGIIAKSIKNNKMVRNTIKHAY